MCTQDSIHDCITNFIIHGLLIGTADEELVLRADDKADGGSAWGPSRGKRWQVSGQEGPELWLHSHFHSFSGIKIFQGHRDIFCYVWSCVSWPLESYLTRTLMILTGSDSFNFDIMTMTGAHSARYLYVDEVLAVLDGVDISLENWVLTGSSGPTISRAQNLNENNIALLLCNILTLEYLLLSFMWFFFNHKELCCNFTFT